VYIISNYLSELSVKGGDNEENGDSFQFNLKARFIEWANQLPLDDIKSQSLSLAQKLLHRFRLILLKTDNHLMKLIDKISQRDKAVNGKNNNNENAPNFWEDLAKNQQQKQVIPPVMESEVKIDLAMKNEAVKKFFDPVRNLSDKEMDIKKPIKISNELSIKSTKVSNGVDIQPAKKTLKIKKSPK